MIQNKNITDLFKDIELKIQSELFSHKELYDPLAYDSVNFKSRILTPLIEGFFKEIDLLTYNDFLLSKIDLLIAGVNSKEKELEPQKEKRMVKCQIAHFKHLVSAFTAKQTLIRNFIENPINDKTDPKLLTKLSRNQTALLILYLQEAEVIKPYQSIYDDKMCDAFGELTGYKGEQLRKVISASGRKKHVITTDKKLFHELKEMFLSLANQVDKDLLSFN